jgi:hypothetical protein
MHVRTTENLDWADDLGTALLLSILFYFVVVAPRLKIDKSGPTGNSPRALSDQQMEDLEDRGGIW